MEIEHPLLAMMFTDIKGYSRLMSEDESHALSLLAEHNQVMEDVFDEFGGRTVKKLGDAYMVVFDDSESAVNCALLALSRISARNRRSKQPIEIRVGIHEGAMLEREGDYFGENVNIAARLEQMTASLTVAVSERVIQAVATRVNAEGRFLGAQALKNLRYPVSVYQLTPADTWKLYLSPDGTAADTEHSDVLGEITTAEAAWRRVEELALEGDLHKATRLSEAALSCFGGKYDDYAHLAALYLIAHMESEAHSALKLGEMLGQKDAEAEQYDWITALVSLSEDGRMASPDDLAEVLTCANEFVTNHPQDLTMRVLVESLKSRVTGHLEGLAALAQRHSNCALVLRGYAEALKDQHRDADAYQMLEQAMAVGPDVPEHHLRRVEWLLDSEELEVVLQESDTLAKKFPSDPRVYQWTGKTRLINLDPCGAQWLFEQAQETQSSHRVDSTGWLVCSLMQQGRFEDGVEQARREMRSAIRQNRPRRARIYMRLATLGARLEHWDGVLEVLEEFKRYDADAIGPRAQLIVAKHSRKLLPWDRALAQLGELAISAYPSEYPHASGLTAAALLPAVSNVEHWEAVHQLEFLRNHRDWIIERDNVDLAAAEARGALRFGTLEDWHLQLVPVLTRLRNRLEQRLPSILALAGLIQAKFNNFEAARIQLEQARKLWRNADWPVWEIQEAESVLAAGPAEVGEGTGASRAE
jgi:class 3 adenylate cyclase